MWCLSAFVQQTLRHTEALLLEPLDLLLFETVNLLMKPITAAAGGRRMQQKVLAMR